MESVSIQDVSSLNIRELASEPNLIKCPGCCTDSLSDASNLRRHLQELQNRLEDIQCFACGKHVGDLQQYIDHLEICFSVNASSKQHSHVTEIECSSFAEIGAENQSPIKLPVPGLKITLVPGLGDSNIPASKNGKVGSPVTSVVKDGTKKFTKPIKRPLEPAQSDEAKCAKIRATSTCVVEPLSDMSPSLDEPAIDDIFEDDNFDSLEDPLQLEPTAQTSRSVNESSLNPIQLKSLDPPTPPTPAKISKDIVYKCKKCEFKTTLVEEQKKHHCSPTNCPYCDKTFKNSLMAGPHIKKHKLDTLEFELNEVLKKGSLTNKSQYCPKCKKHISLSVIDLHHKIHGEGGGFYSCGTCKTFFVTKNALNQHSKESCGASIIDVPTLEKRLQKMLKCSECGSLFHSLAELLEHNKADHKDLYSCFVCGVPFRSTLALRKHIDANHKDKMVSRKKTAASKSSNQYECQFCAIAVSTRVKLIAHILQKHPEIETELSAKAVAQGVCTPYCTVCRFEVNDGELHNRLHSCGVKVYPCSECPEKFIHQERLKKHAHKVHGLKIARSFNCDDCSSSFNNVTSLVLHAHNNNHSLHLLEGKTILTCRFCPEPHLRARDLWLHEKAHEAQGDTPVREADPNAKCNFTEKDQPVEECNECHRTFKSKIAAEVHAVGKNHMSGFEYLQPIDCYYCGKKFVRKLDMKRHMGIHIQGSFPCKICAKPFPTACNLRKHSAVHARFICCYCKKPKASEQELLEHTRTSHKDMSGMVKCNPCVKYFVDKEQLQEHCRSMNHIESQMNETMALSNDLFFCDVCQNCVSSDFKDFHLILHSRGVEKFFNCPACPKQFCTAANLGSHVLLNHDGIDKELTFSCPKCTLVTPSTLGLANHYKTHNDDSMVVKPFICKYCPKAFRRSGDRRKHELIHEGTKAHACNLCPKTFRLPYLLTMHMRTHTNERPYVCTLCNMSFKAGSALRNHKMSKHQSERPHTCKYCSKTYKTRGALGNHIGVHEMLFKCNDCGRSFASRNAATTHIKKIHLNKDRELFECIICNAAYGRALFLSIHMKTHGKLAEKEDLVQQLMEMSYEASKPAPPAKKTRSKKKK